MNINCSNAYYTKTNKSNRPYLYCNINEEVCPLVKFCNTENRIVNTDGYVNCKMKEVDKMPNGKYQVKFNDKGFLYVDIKDINQTRKVKNPYDYVPKFVDIVEVNGEYYIKGYEPKEEVIEEVTEVTEEPKVEEPKVRKSTKK